MRGALLVRSLALLLSSAVGLRIPAPRAPPTSPDTSAAVALDRRTLLWRGAAALPLLLSSPAPTLAQPGVPEGMKTSESYTNLQQIAPEVTGTLGAGTMSSRSRPATGVVLLEEVQESGKRDAPTVTAELVLDGGVAATATFQAEYPLNRGMFYDVEVRSLSGDGAFLQVAALPEGKTLADVSDKFLTKAVFSTEGRFGAYGAPTDIKVLKSESSKMRMIDVAFSALSPGQTEVPRRTYIAALQPDGSTDVVMLVGGSTASSWKKCEPAMRSMASSFRISRTRPTSIKRKSKNDYRFENQGGLNEKNTDSVANLADF